MVFVFLVYLTYMYACLRSVWYTWNDWISVGTSALYTQVVLVPFSIHVLTGHNLEPTILSLQVQIYEILFLTVHL